MTRITLTWSGKAEASSRTVRINGFLSTIVEGIGPTQFGSCRQTNLLIELVLLYAPHLDITLRRENACYVLQTGETMSILPSLFAYYNTIAP